MPDETQDQGRHHRQLAGETASVEAVGAEARLSQPHAAKKLGRTL